MPKEGAPASVDIMISPPSRVAFQGAFGAFSHEACRACLPHADPVPFETFAAAFAAVREGACALGFIPFRNSSAGAVPEVAELLPASGLEIMSEHAWPIHLQLLGRPGSTLAEIEVVASHPMALKQCRRALAELAVRIEPAYDTAGAAKALAGSADRRRAVGAPRAAAELYGLDILRADIEDLADNTTWFAVVRRAP